MADLATDLEAQRLDRLAARLEAKIHAAFVRFLRACNDPVVIARVADLLERGDVNGALAVIDSHIRVFGTIIPDIFRDAAVAETAAAAGQIGAAVGIGFDPGLPEAAALMRASQLEFVQRFTDSQREATRIALSNALEAGQPPTAAAAVFQSSIGLAPVQVLQVARYRQALERASATALDRQMRDMRFDPIVEAAVESGEPIAPAKINQMVEAYRRRSIAFRATTIARTEALRVMSEAQEAAMRQIMRQADISQNQVEQTWIANDDERTRNTHVHLNGQKQPLGSPFISISGARLRYPGDPLAPAEEVVNCRCRRVFRVLLPNSAG